MATVRSVPALPNTVWETILDKFGACDQIKLRRVCRRFSELMSFSFVDLDKFRSCCDVSLEDHTGLADIFCYLTAVVPARRIRMLVSHKDWGTHTREQSSKCLGMIPRQLAATFPELTTLIVPKMQFYLDFLEYLLCVQVLAVAKISLPESGLSDASRLVFQNLRSFSVKSYVLVEDWRRLLTFPTQCVHKILVLGSLTEADVLVFKANAPRLWGFQLYRANVHAVEHAALKHFEQLMSFSLEDCRGTVDFGFLSRLTCLTSLGLSDTRSFQVASLRHLPNLRALLSLNVSCTDAVRDELLSVLRAAECQLRSLRAWAWRVDGFSSEGLVAYLEWCKWLKVLEVKGHRSLTDIIFRADGAYLHTLEELNIVHTKCGQAGLDLFRRKRHFVANVNGVCVAPKISVKVSFSYQPGTQTAAEDGFNVEGLGKVWLK